MGLRRRYVLVSGAVSLITMPITAIWFLLVGGAVLASSSVASAVQPARSGPSATAASIGVGLLVGPVLYLSLALVSA